MQPVRGPLLIFRPTATPHLILYSVQRHICIVTLSLYLTLCYVNLFYELVTGMNLFSLFLKFCQT